MVVAAAVAVAVLPLAGVPVAAAALVLGAVLLLALGIALVGWRAARAGAARSEAVAAAARATQRDDREQLERHVRRLEGQRRQQSQLVQRLRQSWQAEREWSRELRGQLQRMSHGLAARGGDDGDVRDLVLRAAIKLVDAEKGLLVSRLDADGDGSLDVVRSHGFDHDPADSAVVQRFAREGLARDEIVREDQPPTPDGATPADAEIETLVAIPLYLHDEFTGVIICANRPGGFEEVDDELLLALGDHAGAALHHGRVRHELQEARRAVLRVLAETVAAHDPLLHRETCELVIYGGLVANELGLDQCERDVVRCATLLRAVGYLALPEEVRLSPRPLTPDERSLIELHPRIGFSVIVQAPALRDVATAVLYHHERWDGKGYPAGLAGSDIPVAARVLAVLETFGAMTHDRPHRTRLSAEEACQAIVAAAGTQLDPEIVQLMVEQVRAAPPVGRRDLAGAVLDALPEAAEDGVSDVLAGSMVDNLTLLGDRRGMQQAVSAATRDTSAFAVVVLELVDLPGVNESAGFGAGDQLIQQAARRARRAAARLGGTAYRLSGRRLAIFVPAREGSVLSGTVDDVRAEFLGGPTVRVAMSAWMPGEPSERVLSRARAALSDEAPAG